MNSKSDDRDERPPGLRFYPENNLRKEKTLRDGTILESVCLVLLTSTALRLLSYTPFDVFVKKT